MSILILMCSFLGCPWLTAAPVESMTNLFSLQNTNSGTVRQQRLSSLLVSLMIGVSPFVAPLLNTIPTTVLYGVIVYMSVSVILKTELFLRVASVCAPWKWNTEYKSTNVKMWKIAILTTIQLFCMLILWGMRSLRLTSIFFLATVISSISFITIVQFL